MKALLSLISYQFRKIFLDKRIVVTLLFLFCTNLFLMRFWLEKPAVDESGELFGASRQGATNTVSYTVSSEEEYYGNLEKLRGAIAQSYSGSDGLYRIYNEKLLGIYGSLESNRLIPGSDFTDSRFFSYIYDTIFVAAAVILVAIAIYTDDNKSGAHSLDRTAKNGGAMLSLAKLVTLLLTVMLCTALFFLGGLLIFGNDLPLGSAVQVLPDMALCPYEISVAEYLVIAYLCRFISIFTFSMICLPVISVSRSILLSTSVSVAVAALCRLSAEISTTSQFGFEKYLSLFKTADPGTFFSKYAAVAISGRIYGAIHICLAAALTLISVLTAVYFCIYTSGVGIARRAPKKSARGAEKRSEPKRLPRRNYALRTYGMSLTNGEAFKCFFCSKLCPLSIIILIILTCGLVSEYSGEPDANEQIYRSFMNEYSAADLSGSYWNDIKAENIEKTAEILENKQRLWKTANQDFMSGKIPLEEYDEILTNCSAASIQREVFRKIENYSDYLASKRNVSFVYDTGWNIVFTEGISPLAYFLILAVSVGLFGVECDGKTSAFGMDIIIRTTKKGRKELFRSKSVFLLLCCMTLFVYHESLFTALIDRKYSLPLMGASADSLILLRHVPEGLTLARFFALNEVCKFILFTAFAFSLSGLTYLIKSRSAAMVAGVIIILLPELFGAKLTAALPDCFVLILFALFAEIILSLSAYLKWTRNR